MLTASGNSGYYPNIKCMLNPCTASQDTCTCGTQIRGVKQLKSLRTLCWRLLKYAIWVDRIPCQLTTFQPPNVTAEISRAQGSGE